MTALFKNELKPNEAIQKFNELDARCDMNYYVQLRDGLYDY